MRYKIIFSFIILFANSAIAQKCKLSAELFSNYSIYNFSTTLPYSIPSRELKGRLGYEAELRYSYTSKEKLTYYVGVGYTKYNYTGGKTELHYSDQIIPKPGFTPQTHGGEYPVAAKINYSYNYFCVPVGVQYAVSKCFTMGAGIKVLKFLSEYRYTKYYYQTQWKPQSNYNHKTFDNEGDSPWALNAHIEAGYKLPVFKYNIVWKAAFDYALTNYINKQYAALNLYPYTFSLGASLPLYSFCR